MMEHRRLAYEPFACNYGANKYIYQEHADSGFGYEHLRANVAYLAGTARMAMINLTVVASVPEVNYHAWYRSPVANVN